MEKITNFLKWLFAAIISIITLQFLFGRKDSSVVEEIKKAEVRDEALQQEFNRVEKELARLDTKKVEDPKEPDEFWGEYFDEEKDKE